MKVIKRTNKDGSTSWTTVLAMPRDPITGQRQQKRITAHTRREVEQEVARIRNDMRTGSYLEPSRLTLAEYLERWLGSLEPRWRASTYRKHARICRERVGPVLGIVPLARLTPIHIQDCLEAERHSGLGDTTVRYHFGILFAALRQAVRWRLIPSNPGEAVEPPRRRRTEMSTWDAAQVRRFLEATDDDPLAALWRLAVLCGLRRGELLGLRWTDVDLERGVLSVQRGLVEGRQGREFGPPKTEAGRRSVALPDSCRAALRAHRARQAEHRLAAGPAWQDHGLVFPRADGRFLPPSTLGLRWNAAQKTACAADPPEERRPRLRFHDLRHTAASLTLALGTHPKVVQEQLGHSSAKMTLDRYSHVAAGLQHEAAARLDEAVSEGPPEAEVTTR